MMLSFDLCSLNPSGAMPEENYFMPQTNVELFNTKIFGNEHGISKVTLMSTETQNGELI